MSTRTQTQNAQLHRLLTLTSLGRQKKALVYSYSSGRTESSSELSKQECEQLINYLSIQDEHMHGRTRKLICHLLALLDPQRYAPCGKLKNRAIDDTVKAMPVNTKKKALSNLGGSELNEVATQIRAMYRKETKKEMHQ
jgi:hypothetical protein